MKWQNLQAELYQGIPITLGGDLYNSMLVECNGLLFATGRLSEFDTSCKAFGGSSSLPFCCFEAVWSFRDFCACSELIC